MKCLKELRTAKGYTQTKLACELGVGQSTVAEWESGAAMPNASKLPELADGLGCTIDALYGREPPGPQADPVAS